MIRQGRLQVTEEALLAPMIEGKKQFAFAWLERQSRYNLADVSLKATGRQRWSLSGHKGVGRTMRVGRHPHRARPHHRCSPPREGPTLFVVDPSQGITRRDYPTQDALARLGTHLRQVSVGATLCWARSMTPLAWSRTGSTAPSWRLCGGHRLMDAIKRATLEYIKTRKHSACRRQFQVLQHRMSTASPTPGRPAR